MTDLLEKITLCTIFLDHLFIYYIYFFRGGAVFSRAFSILDQESSEREGREGKREDDSRNVCKKKSWWLSCGPLNQYHKNLLQVFRGEWRF